MRITSRAIVLKDEHILINDRNHFGHKYIALPGGGVEEGESNEQAAIREVKEECSIVINNPRLVIIEDAGETFGLQYIFLCDYVSGEPMLDPNSPEAEDNKDGKNLYAPLWLPLKELGQSNLLPAELKDLIVKFTQTGFPKEPVELKISEDTKV